MKDPKDTRTVDIGGPVPGRRGRPPSGTAFTSAERQAARRKRLKEEARSAATFVLSDAVLVALARHVQFKDVTRDVVVDKILSQYLLRKR